MKKTCNGCKALENSGNSVFCYLYYKVKTGYEDVHCFGGVHQLKMGIPLEECPKPRTYKKYMECRKSRLE